MNVLLYSSGLWVWIRPSHPQLSPCHVQVACQIWCHDEIYTCDTYQPLHAPHNITVQEAHLLFTIKLNLATYMHIQQMELSSPVNQDRKPIQRGSLFSPSHRTHVLEYQSARVHHPLQPNHLSIVFCLSSKYYNCQKCRDMHCRLS